MTWLAGILRAHPEIAFFMVLGLGYLLGKISLGGFKLGAVTGTLLAGVIVGQLGVTLPNEVKQCFFLLFLFAIGFRTGPQFFRGLRSDGLEHAALAAIVATTGLVVSWLVARMFGYDPGTAAGLLAGSLTESAAIGTAMDAIAKLDAPEAVREAMANNIAVAFAVTYLVGVIGAAWVLSQLAPRLLRIEGLDVEVVEGDVLDLDSVFESFRGVRGVFHLAGIISIMPGSNEFVRRVNVDGTCNVLRAAEKSGIKKLVYTSSIHAIKRAEDGVVNEALPYDPDNPYGAYDRSKAEATLDVLNAAHSGLEAVVA